MKKTIAMSLITLMTATTLATVTVQTKSVSANADILSALHIHESPKTKQAIANFTKEERVASSKVNQQLQERGITKVWRKAKLKGYKFSRKTLTFLEKEAKNHKFAGSAKFFKKLEAELKVMHKKALAKEAKKDAQLKHAKKHHVVKKHH